MQVTVYLGGFEHSYFVDASDPLDNKEGNEIRIGATKLRFGQAMPNDDGDDIEYVVGDHLGSVSITVSSTGSILYKEEYRPYGETAFGSYKRKRYRFCGKELDAESGLYYYGLRYYAAWTCRFINIDPLWAKYPFYTPYQYAGCMSINFIDLDGAEPAPNPFTGGTAITNGTAEINAAAKTALGNCMAANAHMRK